MRPSLKTLIAASVLGILATGCSTPRYSLKAVSMPPQSIEQIQQYEAVISPGKLTTLKAVTDVSPILSSTYIVANVVVTNNTTNCICISKDQFRIVIPSAKGDKCIEAIEPEIAVAELCKQRASRESGRNWTALATAAASGQHSGYYSGMTQNGTMYSGNYSYADTGEQLRTLQAQQSANAACTQQESLLVRTIDQTILRPCQIPPAESRHGLLLFPFSQSESYILRVTLAEDTHELRYQLRRY